MYKDIEEKINKLLPTYNHTYFKVYGIVIWKNSSCYRVGLIKDGEDIGVYFYLEVGNKIEV